MFCHFFVPDVALFALLTDATPKCGCHTSILSAVKEKVYPKRKIQSLDVTPLLMESQVKFQDSQQKSTEAISDKDRYLVLKCIKKRCNITN